MLFCVPQEGVITLLCVADDHQLLTDISTPVHGD